MKSQVLVITLLAAWLWGSPAHAAFTETANVATKHSTWEKATTTVKTTVKRWLDYWNQGDQPAVQQAEQQPQRKSTPTASGAGEAPAVAETPAPLPRPELTEAHTELREQPVFEERAEGATLKDVRALRDSVKKSAVIGVAKPGRKGTSKLPVTKSGVPRINWKALKASKKIPRLDIGTENLISRRDFTVDKLSWGLAKPSDLKRLPSPAPVAKSEITRALSTPIKKALAAKGLHANLRTIGKKITQEDVDKVKYAIADVPAFKPHAYKPLSEEHMKMVAALILFDKGNQCHMIMGLFNQLKLAAKTKVEATYHLGACADQMKMHQAAFDLLTDVVQTEDKDFAKDALKLLAKELPLIYERDFYKEIKGVKSHKAMTAPEAFDEVVYRMAKGAYRSGDFKTSVIYADQVSDKAEFYDDARFLSAMNAFALGQKKKALTKLEGLWASIEARKMGNSNIRALTSVNLARMYFAQKRYDKALEHYMQVPKDHSLWVQALIEQGWTQLAINDYAGAIGNMYSLHSPYFKAVYQPESFVVRTIGYLNICQYGDAYKTLTFLEKDYRDWFSKMDTYLKSKRKPTEVYSTVKTYIKGKSTDSLQGVPYQVWREMARRKDFLNLQTALNDKSDETTRYEGINEKIKTEKASIRWRAEQAKKRFDTVRAQLKKAKTDRSLAKNIVEWNAQLKREREFTMGYRFQLAILEQSRQGYLAFQKKSQAKLDRETDTITANAGGILLKRANGIRTELSRVLENNEFLRYEVFAGSGENIRYQVAGGEISGEANRVPAHIRPTKMMNWNFDGEFWEDEIGSYRSSLRNNCPSSDQAKLDRGN